MHAIVLFPNGGLRISTVKLSPLKHSYPRAIYGKEIADGTLHLASQGCLLRSSVSCTRCQVNRRGRPRKNYSTGKPPKEADKSENSPTSDSGTSKSSSQEKIIALFRRIRSSISKDKPAVSKRRSPKTPKEKQAGKSVLSSLQQYPRQKQVRDTGLSRDDGQVTSLERGALKKDDTKKDASFSGSFKSRPVPKFVKRSPIPAPSSTHADIKVAEEQSSTVAPSEVSELQTINEMRLPELKELARKKGVKGYSKLKKSELLEVLNGLLQSP